MRLDVERTGGFAGRTVRWSVDLDALDPDRRAEVHDLLAQADGWASSAGPDRFSYRVVTSPAPDQPAPEQPATARFGLDVRFADPLPEAARRLVELVRAGAPPTPS